MQLANALKWTKHSMEQGYREICPLREIKSANLARVDKCGKYTREISDDDLLSKTHETARPQKHIHKDSSIFPNRNYITVLSYCELRLNGNDRSQ